MGTEHRNGRCRVESVGARSKKKRVEEGGIQRPPKIGALVKSKYGFLIPPSPVVVSFSSSSSPPPLRL